MASQQPQRPTFGGQRWKLQRQRWDRPDAQHSTLQARTLPQSRVGTSRSMTDFRYLQKFLPKNDQKRDKSSFLLEGSGGGMAINPQLPQENHGYYPAKGQQVG